MTIVIEDAEFDAAVQRLAEVTGEPTSESLKVAVQERLDRVTHRKGRELLERIRPLLDEVARMPVLDMRSADEIVGYNEFGCFD
jgi:antitoxin VapB